MAIEFACKHLNFRLPLSEQLDGLLSYWQLSRSPGLFDLVIPTLNLNPFALCNDHSVTRADRDVTGEFCSSEQISVDDSVLWPVRW